MKIKSLPKPRPYRVLWIVFLLIFVGCSPDPSGNVKQANTKVQSENDIAPPSFCLGDTVAVPDSVRIGIVISQNRQAIDGQGLIWVYSVMFQNSVIQYSEQNLELVESFDWNRPSRPGVID